MQQKKIPMRKCTGCNEMKPKKELVRIVRGTEGAIFVDLSGKNPGRGAYICRSKECLAMAKKTGRISKSLECAVPEDVWALLEKELADG